MRFPAFLTKIALQRLGACVLIGLLAGCAAVGPAAVRSGRLDYNEAISDTNDRQLLLAVIKNRYQESVNLLAVASVTANIRVTASTSIQAGFGAERNYDGNLVPLTLGAVYEENPTISYVPAAGAKYASRFSSPVPVAAIGELAGSRAESGFIIRALIGSVNGIRNPSFRWDGTGPDPEFGRFSDLLVQLTQRQCLHWTADPRHPDGLAWTLDVAEPVCAGPTVEFMGLLGLEVPVDAGKQVVLPVFLGLDGRASGGVGIVTRSVGDLAEILSGVTEVPEEDSLGGVAQSYPPAGLVGEGLRISYASAEPTRASVSVRYRGGWFYIDEADLATKRYFRLMSALWSQAIAESAMQGRSGPVLTVPVSR